MEKEYRITIGSVGVRRETGEVVEINKTGIVFKYKKPPGSKRIKIEIPAQNILAIKIDGVYSQVLFMSSGYEFCQFQGVRKVRPSEIMGLNVGEMKKGRKFYFSPLLTEVSSILKNKYNKKTSTSTEERKPKGTKITLTSNGSW